MPGLCKWTKSIVETRLSRMQ